MQEKPPAVTEINSMSNSVLIAVGSEFLLLTLEQFQEALDRGRTLVPQTSTLAVREVDEILDADGIAERTQIPASWFLEQARQRKLCHLRAGKYVRFCVTDVLDALQTAASTDQRTVSPKNDAQRQRVIRPCYRTATTKDTCEKK
jgi:hypothetical protein